MNHAIWPVGLCFLLTAAGCAVADAPREAEASAPLAAPRVDAVGLALPAVVDAGRWTIVGEFQFKPSPGAAPPALPAVLEVRDPSGTTIARLETSTDKPIAMPVPEDAAGLLTVAATVTGAAGGTLTASAEVFAGTLAALGPLATEAEGSLRSRLAAADGPERRELERQLTVVRFARVWLDTEGTEVESNELAELSAARCARVLYKGPADSLADTCARLRERLRAEGARPTGELRCLYWAGAGGRGAGEGIWELVFVLE